MSSGRKRKDKRKKEEGGKNKPCPRCHGDKEIIISEKLADGHTRETVTRCNLCYGSGKEKQ